MATDSVPDLNKHPGSTEQATWVMMWLMNELTAHRQLMECAVKLFSTTIANVDVSPQRSTAAEYGENFTSSHTSIPPPSYPQYHRESTGTRQCQKKCDNTTNRSRSSAKEEPSHGTTEGYKVHTRQAKPTPPTSRSRTSHSPDCQAAAPLPSSFTVRVPQALEPPPVKPRLAPLAQDLHTVTDSMSYSKSAPHTPQISTDCSALADTESAVDSQQVCGPPPQHGKGGAESKGTLYHTQQTLPRGPCHAAVQGHLLQQSTALLPSSANIVVQAPNSSTLLGGKTSPQPKRQDPLTATHSPTRSKGLVKTHDTCTPTICSTTGTVEPTRKTLPVKHVKASCNRALVRLTIKCEQGVKPPKLPQATGGTQQNQVTKIIRHRPPLEEAWVGPHQLAFFGWPGLHRCKPKLPHNFELDSSNAESNAVVKCLEPQTLGSVTIRDIIHEHQTRQLHSLFASHGWDTLVHKDVHTKGTMDMTFLNTNATPNSALRWLTRKAILHCLLPHPHKRVHIPPKARYGVHYYYSGDLQSHAWIHYDVITTKKLWLDFDVWQFPALWCEDHHTHHGEWFDPHEWSSVPALGPWFKPN
eukprot:TRINITY_DN67672_c3_g5_i1.p1 TRINITY_DN67672_c3_g5~~TRINITY_DN67672_c3_g5_i1.p1  ORF type:complete len:583 (-),score=0.43 TRINITY_DN67672_c3_g5_i1:416-2164(-)